jgi:hypothetical protein
MELGRLIDALSDPWLRDWPCPQCSSIVSRNPQWRASALLCTVSLLE